MTAKILIVAKRALEGLYIEKILEIYADKFLFEDTSSMQSITTRTSLRTYYNQLFNLPGVCFSDIGIFESDHFAAIEWTWSGLNLLNDNIYHVRGVSIMELSEGKVSRESIYYDPKTAFS
jgi:hypothetical protein